jgi:hypothetical protein
MSSLILLCAELIMVSTVAKKIATGVKTGIYLQSNTIMR